MPEPTDFPEADLDTQLRGLFQEAEEKMQGRAAAQAAAKTDPDREGGRHEERAVKGSVSLPQLLRPLILELEAISRATGENSDVLQRLDQAASEAAAAQKSLPRIVGGLEALLEQKNGVNQSMFNALHEELKDYKDGFMLESVLKPIIRDLISLYDDLTTIHLQIQDCVTQVAGTPDQTAGLLLERFKTMEMNIAHHVEFVVEILARLEVNLMHNGTGQLDKQTQRAVAVEIAEDPDQDMMIVRTSKRGFLWKDRVLRAEEVVVRKWKEGFLVALANPRPQK
ncbi:MAG: hypothetical protein QOE70_5889 [Chthoniobacter sp.]|jgi:molecular chaperone GrpE (heat shock protein)|nr:hypothetical protein [Chthoniobacter sp.]